MCTKLEKRHLACTPNLPFEVEYNETSAKLCFARLLAVNKDIDILYPYVNGRRLSDVEALALGYVPPQLQQKVLATMKNVSNGVDNSGLSNGEIAKNARLNSLGLERSERLNMLDSSGLLDLPLENVYENNKTD